MTIEHARKILNMVRDGKDIGIKAIREALRITGDLC